MSSTPLLLGSRAMGPPSALSRNRAAILVTLGLFVVATELVSVLSGNEGVLLSQVY